MTSLDIIRHEMKKLYDTNPNIHINVSIPKSKIFLSKEPAVIKKIYPHLFRIEERSSGSPQCRTLQYTDILTKQIEIVELKGGW